MMFLLILALAAFPGPASANHSWGNYHWARTANPFTLKLGNNVSSTWLSYLENASNEWTKSIPLDTEIVSGSTKPRTCKSTTGRVEVCSEKYGNNGWLGIAQIWISGSHIMQGVVKLNDTYFNAAKYNTPAWRNLVMCQEVGHTFGLDHQDEGFDGDNLGTCMDYTNDPDGGAGGETFQLAREKAGKQLAGLHACTVRAARCPGQHRRMRAAWHRPVPRRRIDSALPAGTPSSPRGDPRTTPTCSKASAATASSRKSAADAGLGSAGRTSCNGRSPRRSAG